MRLQTIFLASAAVVMTACATAPTVPAKRPITAEAKAKIGNPDVNVTANTVGVGATWFMTQSNGGGAGIAGVIGAAIADAIINAAPSSRASKTANEVAETVIAEDLNDSLMAAMKAVEGGDSEISIRSTTLVNGFDKSLDNDGKVVLTVNYMLAEDASAFKAVALAQYEREDMPYVTPYTFEGSVPKNQKGGPLYSNSFTFNSTQFAQPVLTEALKAELVKAVEDSFRGEDGSLPTEGSEFKKMQKSIANANDDKLTKSETSVFLVQSWLADEAEPMKAEIEQAHEFIAKYLLVDLNSTEIPRLDGMDKVIETLDSGRVVKLIGQGTAAGSYISEPGNVESFTTYGNAVKYSKVGLDEVSAAKAAASGSK